VLAPAGRRCFNRGVHMSEVDHNVIERTSAC
jgi:hypothetical protein